MHPILTNARLMGLYLLGYLPIGIVLMIGYGHAGTFGTAAAFFVPLTLLYAFLGTMAFYLCRTFPIGSYRIYSALPAQLVAALIVGAISVGVAWAWAGILETLNIGVQPRMYLAEPMSLFALGSLLFCLAIAFHYVLISASDMQASESRALQADLLVREAELKALRAQLNPHFLFNSLNSVSSLTTTDPKAARQMCLLLADFLRDTLKLGSVQRLTVENEFAVLKRYLSIEQVRLGERLSVRFECDEAAAQQEVPALLLQPLVENAVIHGISHLLNGGTVTVSAECKGEVLKLKVDNPVDADRPKSKRSGVGLMLVHQRLQAHYGAAQQVEVREEEGMFRVEIRVPCTPEVQA